MGLLFFKRVTLSKSAPLTSPFGCASPDRQPADLKMTTVNPLRRCSKSTLIYIQIDLEVNQLSFLQRVRGEHGEIMKRGPLSGTATPIWGSLRFNVLPKVIRHANPVYFRLHTLDTFVWQSLFHQGICDLST